MKRKIYLGVYAVVLLCAFSFFPVTGESAEPIKMLDLSPQSGVMKDVGDRNQIGVRFAVEEINAAGGLLGRPVEAGGRNFPKRRPKID